jgi:hypothetical protein
LGVRSTSTRGVTSLAGHRTHRRLTMPHHAIALLGRLFVGVGMALNIQSAHAQYVAPCQQIRDACEQAGFVPGGVRDGVGLFVDCIRPLMQGAPPRPRAAMPPPRIDPQLIAACQARNPAFGGAPQAAEWGPPPGRPGGPPPVPRRMAPASAATAPSQPPGPPSPQDQAGPSDSDQPPTRRPGSPAPSAAPQSGPSANQ